MPGTSSRPLQAAPLRLVSSLSEVPVPLLARLLLKRRRCRRRGASASIYSTHHCRCSVAGPQRTRKPSSQPSFVCHHPWDTIMIQAETIALAGLVSSLHANPVGLLPGAGGTSQSHQDCEIPYAFITACCTGQGGLTRDGEDTSLPNLATPTRPLSLRPAANVNAASIAVSG